MFAALAGGSPANFSWTRGAPNFYASSNLAQRGFCARCGTPLSFQYHTPGDRVNFTIGSLDHPELFPPHANTGNESRVPWFDTLPIIAHGGATEQPDREAWWSAIQASNHQHPDHDTEVWPQPDQTDK